MFDQEDIKELILIDDTMTAIMLGAEAKLQPFRTSDVFSSKLHAAKSIRHYWRKILHLKKASTHYSLKKYYEHHRPENIELPRHEIKEKPDLVCFDHPKLIFVPSQDIIRTMIRALVEWGNKEPENIFLLRFGLLENPIAYFRAN